MQIILILLKISQQLSSFEAWINGELFADIPTDGLVVKVNSGNTKKRLGVNSVCPNWAIAMKD